MDLRSDTVTCPSTAMLAAMHGAALGDDVYGEDPTVNELERFAAELTGKEAAVFAPSGTQTNMVMLAADTQISPLQSYLMSEGIRISGTRWVFHQDVTDADVDHLIAVCLRFKGL